LSQADALQHALAVAPQRTVGGVGEIDARQQPINPGVQRQATQSVQPAMEAQQLDRGQRLVKAEVLGQKSNPRTHRAIAQGRAEYLARPRARRDEREQHLD
jgi:hypothetical protein